MSPRVLATFFAAGGIAFAAAAPGNHFAWSGYLAPGQLIEIKGVNGDVRAEAGTSRKVEVRAEKKGRRSDPAGVRIETINNGNGTTICAVYPTKAGRAEECRPGISRPVDTQNNDVRVDFTVRVPHGVRFIGRTLNGSVHTNRLSADVEAHTLNGKIVVDTSGAALAETANGSIHAILRRSAWDGVRTLSAINGSIEVELPANANARVDATTVNGHIITDFPMTLTGRFVNRRMRGTLGRGGRELKINTVNGTITLRNLSASTV